MNDDVSLTTEDLDDLRDIFDNVYQSGSIGKAKQSGSQVGSDGFDVSSDRVKGRKKRKASFTEDYDDIQRLRAEFQRSKAEETKKQLEYKLKKLNLQQNRRELQERKVQSGNENLDVHNAHFAATSELTQKSIDLRQRSISLRSQNQEHKQNVMSDREQAYADKIEKYKNRQKVLGQKKVVSDSTPILQAFIKANSSTPEGKSAGKDLNKYWAQVKQQAAQGNLGQPISNKPYSDQLSSDIMSKLPMGFNSSLPSDYQYIKDNANYSDEAAAKTASETQNYSKNWMQNSLANTSGMRIQVPAVNSPNNNGVIPPGLQKGSIKPVTSSPATAPSTSQVNNTEIRWWIKMQDALDEINENIKKLVNGSATKEKLPPAFYARKAVDKDEKGDLLSALAPLAAMLGALVGEKFGPIQGLITNGIKAISDLFKAGPKIYGSAVRAVRNFFNRGDNPGDNPGDNVGDNPEDHAKPVEDSNLDLTGKAYSLRQLRMGNNLINARREHEFLSENGTSEEKAKSFERMQASQRAFENRYGSEALRNLNENGIPKPPIVPPEAPKPPGLLNSLMNGTKAKLGGFFGTLGKVFGVGGQGLGAWNFGTHAAQSYNAFQTGDNNMGVGKGLEAAGDALGIASIRAKGIYSPLLFAGSVGLSQAGQFAEGLDYHAADGESNWDIFHKAKDLQVAKTRRFGLDAAGIAGGAVAGGAIGTLIAPGIGTIIGAGVGGLAAAGGQAYYNWKHPIEDSLQTENGSATNVQGQSSLNNGNNTISNSYTFNFPNASLKSPDEAKKFIQQALQARDNTMKANEGFSNAGMQDPSSNTRSYFGPSF